MKKEYLSLNSLERAENYLNTLQLQRKIRSYSKDNGISRANIYRVLDEKRNSGIAWGTINKIATDGERYRKEVILDGQDFEVAKTSVKNWIDRLTNKRSKDNRILKKVILENSNVLLEVYKYLEEK